jgi:alkyl sulfatase BDS1-like metallo-beta-lactamase superfamily hydrolase
LCSHLPDLKAFGGAELLSHTLHNLYTLRGAKVRDALKWAGYLNESLNHTAEAEVVFTQHHWPVWGQARIREFIANQRDAYKFIHDQTVRMINAGLTATEIAETLTMPKPLNDYLNVHGYYGTVSHNVKAVYQHYMGWFDAHPSNLNALPPVDAGKRYVAMAGGMDKLMTAAQTAFDAGDYRWAAEVLKHAVYADPKHTAARELLARSFEQMGYVAESAPWRKRARSWPQPPATSCPADWRSLVRMPARSRGARSRLGTLPATAGGNRGPRRRCRG